MWYNRKDLIIENLVDLTFLAAMGPPGGGKTRITDRICRHFNILSYVEVDKKTIQYIYSKIVTHFLSKFEKVIKDKNDIMIDLVIDVYNQVK